MNFYIQFIFVIMSFLASLTSYVQPRANIYLRSFSFFLFLTMVVEIIAHYIKNNNPIYGFFGIVEFVFYFTILRAILKSPTVKRIILWVIWAYPLISIANIFFIQGITIFPTITHSLGCLLIVIMTIYYFFELFQLPQAINLSRDPAFWICSGLLFFYCCSFPIFGMAKLLASAPLFNRQTLGVILDLLNILLYSSFTIAFLCRLRIRKPLSYP
jgi:hypothetical protein